MPLTRLEVRNEYGLGNPELYRGAARREDPRSVLDGVAVSGLVGILRQLGDLVGFASEIFHDLHEQIMSTSARGHRMMARVQHIEAKLPHIENVVQTQKSHIHFAYLPGCEWHANVLHEHEHLVCCDLPQFMMDSYEECRDPPCLFLLDKFDSAGAGACLKRYSDPSYFKSVWACSQMVEEEKYKNEKKVHRSKGKVRHIMNQEVQRSSYLCFHNSSIQITSPDTDNQSIAADTVSTSDMRLKSDIGSPSASFDSRTRFSCEETVVSAKFSAENGALVSSEVPMTKLEMDCGNECNYTTPDEHYSVADVDPVHDSFQEQNDSSVHSINWDEKKKIFKPKGSDIFSDEIIENANTELSTIVPDQLKLDSVRIKNEQPDMEHLSSVFKCKTHHENSSLDVGDPTSFAGANHSDEVTSTMDECVDKGDVSFHSTNSPNPNNTSSDARSLYLSCSGAYHSDEITSEIDNYVDAVNALESETDTDSEVQTIREVKPSPICSNEKENRHESNLPKSYFLEDDISRVAQDSLQKKMSPEIDSIFLKDVGHTQSLPLNCSDPEKCIHLNNDLSQSTCGPPQTTGNNEIINKQSSRCNISDMQILSSGCSTSKLQTVTKEEKVVEPCKIPDTCTNSDEPPVKMWTNGELLGLEPSKPPDFVKPASLSTSKDGYSYSVPELQDDGSSARYEESLQPHKVRLKNPSCNMKDNELCKPFGLVSPCNSQVVGKTEHEVKPAYATGQPPSCSYHDMFRNSHPTTIHKEGQNLEENENESPVTSAEVTSIKSSPRNICNSSSLPSLACKFLASNLQKKPSFDPVLIQHSILEAANSMVPKERSFPNDERKKHDTLSQGYHELNTNAKLEQVLLEDTGSQKSGPPSLPSPPLEHMKISFQPMNRTVTCKLKLEFPDDHLHESIEELMFPSFQLLPGSAASLNHLNSDSDEDAFFRSSSSYCEDVDRHHSDSDFELWESNEQPVSGNQDMLDVSYTVSSTPSMSVSLDLDKVNHHSPYSEAEHGSSMSMENGIVAFQCGDVMDLPSLDSLNSLISTQEVKCDSDRKDPPIYRLEAPNGQPPTAPLPPLPPVHWRITKPSLSYLEYGHDCRSEVPNLSAGMEAQKSFQLQPRQLEYCPSQPPQTAETGRVTLHSSDSMEPQKIDGDNKVANAKEADEKGNFLHQIRSKSFNLRRTITTKQSFAPSPTANVNVTAILEKANAIRQAVVSSDDGGDENWSDG